MRGVSISPLMHYNRETNARVRCEVDSYVIVHEHLAFDGFRFVGDDLAVANALEFLRGALTNLFPVSLTPGASVLALVFTIIDQHDASVDDHGWLIRIVHVFDARSDDFLRRRHIRKGDETKVSVLYHSTTVHSTVLEACVR